MRTIALVMVKNEDDFIESFIRLNARNIDRFLIADDASSDRTLPILSGLIGEGFDIGLFSIGAPRMGLEQQQSRVLGTMLQSALDTVFDFAFLLDADEVLLADRARTEAELSRLGPAQVGRIPWITHVPMAEDLTTSPNPAKHLFRPLAREVRQYHKAVIPRAGARGITVEPGNHGVVRDGRPVTDSPILDLPLGHFPVRNRDQLIAKALIGHHKLSIKPNRLSGEGYHWDRMTQRLRTSGHRLEFDELQRIAAAYPLIDQTGDALPELAVPHDLPDIELRHSVERTSALARMDAFVGEVLKQAARTPQDGQPAAPGGSSAAAAEPSAATSASATRARDFTPRYDERIEIDAARLETLIATRLYDLRFHLIDLIDVTSDEPLVPATMARIASRLAPFGYRPVATSPVLRFAAPRLTEPQLDGFRDSASRAATLARHGITCRGVIQIGAHVGQEVPLFKALGARRMILVEANPSVYRTLQHNVATMDVNALLANCAITDFDGETELMLASFDQSSSLLPLAHHSVEYPEIRAVGKVRVPARRLDTLVRQEFRVDPAEFNVLEIDVQGAEGLVLRGAGGQLAHVDAVYVEINYKPMYEGCLLIDAIDALLLDAGLIRVETHCAHSPNWGDALYLRLPRTVSMSTLGSNGRLGNQIFQYAWLAALCEEHGLEAHAPGGELRRLFDVRLAPAAADEPVAAPAAEPLTEQALLSLTPFSAQTAACALGSDVKGYFQFHTALWRSRVQTFRRLLAPTPTNQRLQRLIRGAFERRGHVSAIHHRQGDFAQFTGSPVFFTAPLDWYAAALAEQRGGPNPQFVYVASDGPMDSGPLQAAGLTVLRAADLIEDIRRDAGWQQKYGDAASVDPMAVDFLALEVADTLLISNSTFSFAAALLNRHCRLFLRPDASLGRLEPFDPWHSAVLLGLQDEAIRFG